MLGQSADEQLLALTVEADAVVVSAALPTGVEAADASIRIADVDGDGSVDITVFGVDPELAFLPSLQVLRGVGSEFMAGPLHPIPATLVAYGNAPSIFVEGTDLNGEAEVLIVTVDDGEVSVVHTERASDGDPKVWFESFGEPAKRDSWSSAFFDDVDGDGRRDLLLTAGSARQAWILCGDPGGFRAEQISEPMPTAIRAVQDVDGDGIAELLAVGRREAYRARRSPRSSWTRRSVVGPKST